MEDMERINNTERLSYIPRSDDSKDQGKKTGWKILLTEEMLRKGQALSSIHPRSVV